MYITPENAHEYLGKTLDAYNRKLGVYPYTVIQYPDGMYATKDRCGVCSPVSNGRFNQVLFDTVDGVEVREI